MASPAVLAAPSDLVLTHLQPPQRVRWSKTGGPETRDKAGGDQGSEAEVGQESRPKQYLESPFRRPGRGW